MIKTIKLHQARALIHHRNVDNLFYVDTLHDEDCSEIIFKNGLNNQLYSFYYCEDDVPITIYTIQQFDTVLDDDDNMNLDVKVAPVRKITKQITVTKYIGDDSNN